jgi:hypothetical protein
MAKLLIEFMMELARWKVFPENEPLSTMYFVLQICFKYNVD